MIILSKVLKESNQFKILAIKVAAKRTLDNALLLIRKSFYLMPYLNDVPPLKMSLSENGKVNTI